MTTKFTYRLGVASIAIVALSSLLALACLQACSESHEGTLHEDQTLEHDGKTRTYHLYEPANHDEPRPLVLVLHGGFGTIDATIGVGSNRWPHQVWLDIADEENLYVAVPQGLNEHWNDCRPSCERCGDEDDKGFLLALLGALDEAHDIDTSRTFVVGESNGGHMAQRLALEVPEHFAGIGVVISLIPQGHTCTESGQSVPVMYQVGTADAAVLYEGGQAGDDESLNHISAQDTMAYWADVNQCDAVPATHDLPDLDPGDSSTVTRDDYTCASGDALSMLHLVGSGHVPPSIEVQVTALWESVAGIQNHDVEGARAFWVFFQGTP